MTTASDVNRIWKDNIAEEVGGGGEKLDERSYIYLHVYNKLVQTLLKCFLNPFNQQYSIIKMLRILSENLFPRFIFD